MKDIVTWFGSARRTYEEYVRNMSGIYEICRKNIQRIYQVICTEDIKNA